jgi:hypothetical protein
MSLYSSFYVHVVYLFDKLFVYCFFLKKLCCFLLRYIVWSVMAQEALNYVCFLFLLLHANKCSQMIFTKSKQINLKDDE